MDYQICPRLYICQIMSDLVLTLANDLRITHTFSLSLSLTVLLPLFFLLFSDFGFLWSVTSRFWPKQTKSQLLLFLLLLQCHWNYRIEFHSLCSWIQISKFSQDLDSTQIKKTQSSPDSSFSLVRRSLC